MKNFFLFLFFCSLLLASYSCKGFKNDVERITQGYSEQDLKDFFEDSAKKYAPKRMGPDLILKDMSYDDHVLSLYYIIEEEGVYVDIMNCCEIVKKMRLNDNYGDGTFLNLIKEAEITQRIVLKGNESGQTASTFITPQEFEDAQRLK